MNIPLVHLTLLSLLIWSCGAADPDLKILQEFDQLHPETQKFFDRDAKMQCACLKENQAMLEKLLSTSQGFVDSIRAGQLSIESEEVALRIEQEIYTVAASYNNCVSDSPQPDPEVMHQVQEDMRSFSGASEPGGTSHNKMVQFNNALMRKHCAELQPLAIQFNELTQVVSSGIQ